MTDDKTKTDKAPAKERSALEQLMEIDAKIPSALEQIMAIDAKVSKDLLEGAEG